MSADTAELSEALASLRFSSLPSDVVKHAKRLIVDTMLVAYAAATRPVNRRLADVYRQIGGTSESSVWDAGAAGVRLPVVNAVWINTL